PGQYAVLSDTLKPKTLGISSSLNLTVGYFITKNLCAGLSFGPGTSSSYTTFFRYYFNHKRPDSAKFDFFLQGNISFAYTNGDHPAASEYYPYDGDGSVFSNSTTDYKTNTTTLGYGIWIGSAYHLTRHWSVEALAGFLYSNTVQSIGSYTTTATYYGPTIINPETTLLPALKNTSNSYQGAFRLMITYRI
ncbi:MAG TPA: hypothetical protein VK808_11780, partial [Bacteroidia bacterium]|nr:hypothetical protein [Bacteroidia bacterium]